MVVTYLLYKPHSYGFGWWWVEIFIFRFSMVIPDGFGLSVGFIKMIPPVNSQWVVSTGNIQEYLPQHLAPYPPTILCTIRGSLSGDVTVSLDDYKLQSPRSPIIIPIESFYLAVTKGCLDDDDKAVFRDVIADIHANQNKQGMIIPIHSSISTLFIPPLVLLSD